LENVWNEFYNSGIDLEKPLQPQATQVIYLILTSFQIPAEFIHLLESEVFNHGEATNKNSNSAWKQFG
ncbi:15338_t:CDS:1, partial [Dentiscutata heterogama]